MSTLHDYIAEQIKDHPTLEDMTGEEIFCYLFSNYRSTKTKKTGLRLSYQGNTLLSKVFDVYPFEHGLDHLSNSLLIALDKKMVWPYYISKKFIVFYSHSEASWFTLQGKDLKRFVECI